jgi:hypothetical protein
VVYPGGDTACGWRDNDVSGGAKVVIVLALGAVEVREDDIAGLDAVERVPEVVVVDPLGDVACG